jgi:hypothetical protein
MTYDTFASVLNKVAQRDTSADSVHWTTDNPLWGHCTVAALVAQDYFGGRIVRGSIAFLPKYSYLRWHYWNELEDSYAIDFTKEQYKDLVFTDLVGEVRNRDKDLQHEDVARRYTLLRERIKHELLQ